MSKNRHIWPASHFSPSLPVCLKKSATFSPRKNIVLFGNLVRPEYPMGMRLVHKPQLRSRRASCTAWDAKSGNEEKCLVQIFSIKPFPKLKSCFSRINFSVPKKMLQQKSQDSEFTYEVWKSFSCRNKNEDLNFEPPKMVNSRWFATVKKTKSPISVNIMCLVF